MLTSFGVLLSAAPPCIVKWFINYYIMYTSSFSYGQGLGLSTCYGFISIFSWSTWLSSWCRMAMQGKFLASPSMCSIRSVQISLLFLIWPKIEGVFLCVWSCTIHLGVTYLQPLCDSFLSSKGHWFTLVAQMMCTKFIYPLYFIHKTMSETTNTVSLVINTVV